MIEVLVFVSVVTIFFVAAATVSSFSLRIAKSNENKILATLYAEELIEWLRGEKEADWEQFKSDTVSTNPSVDYCFYESPLESSWSATTKLATACTNFDLDNIFKRDMTVSRTSDENQLDVAVTVSWRDGPNTFSVPVKTVLSRFE